MLNSTSITELVKTIGRSLGFQDIGIASINLEKAQQHLQQWLDEGRHGEMSYMANHGSKRWRPEELVEQTRSVISVSINYWSDRDFDPWQLLEDNRRGYISRYALGRDYHKLMRKRLQKMAQLIEQEIGSFGYRVFVDSAPVLEKPLATQAGIGWIGKHTNLVNQHSGSWFFLGEIYTDLPVESDVESVDHCGTCSRCIDICPTAAITAPYRLDARLCISYLTIELKGSIPLELRPLIGNRIFGCDDCQLICPWNRFAQASSESDFSPRHGLEQPDLLELFSWSETEFLSRTEGMAIRRIGHEQWLRNIAIALGNSSATGPLKEKMIAALKLRLPTVISSPMVTEHIEWALAQLDSNPSAAH
ncbi:MAG: tRNA epoxyqueuosine(34) reductase QueG [Gammaproteobacteria bacterium]|nr:tRNA epoxyqueuosine(34) reductase QueG [Gammaproteobacteria bacterium]